MAERHSWAVGAVAGVGQVDELDARLTIGGLVAPSGQITSRGGLFPAADVPGWVSATTPTPNGEVHVAPFRGALQSGRPGGGGVYIMCLDAIKTIDVLGTAPADPANDRIDLIVFQQADAYHGDANSDLVVRHVVGTPAVTPVDPDPTAGGFSPDYILRARITVVAGATTIEQTDIENIAVPTTVAVGGIVPVFSTGERDAILQPYAGMTVYRRDHDWIEVYDGAWRVSGVATAASLTALTSAVSNPYSGQLGWVTNPGLLYRWTGSTWQVYPNPPAASLRQTVAHPLANNAWTPVTFTTEDVDTHGGHDNDTNPHIYRAQVAGLYELAGALATAANATGIRGTRWHKNGTNDASVILGSGMFGPNLGAVSQPVVPARTIQVQLAVNDFVCMAGFQSSGAPLDTFVGAAYVQSTMSVKWLRP